MKVLSLVILAASASPAVAAVDIAMVSTCMTNYAQTTDANECSSLVTLAKCFALAGVDELDGSDTTRKMADDFLLGQQTKADFQTKCKSYESEGQPEIRITRGELEMDLDNADKDMKFNRLRRRQVSLFGMNRQIQDLEEAVDGLPAQIAAAKVVADSVEETVINKGTKLNEDLEKVQSDFDKLTVAADVTSSLESDLQAEDAASTQALSSLKAELLSSINSGTQQAISAINLAQSDDSAGNSNKFAAYEAKLTRLSASVDTVAKARADVKQNIIGWTQCDQRGANGADHSNFVAMTCSYKKKRDDTIMYISVNSNQRQINGNSMWRLEMKHARSGGWQHCKGPGNNGNGNMYTRYHGSYSTDLHRPMFIGGACYMTNNGQKAPAGTVEMRYRQTYVHYDSYWNWESTARMIMEERSDYTQ
jgi:hypothetical protein